MYAVHKHVYADGRAYRYRFLDENEQLHYTAEATGMTLPVPTRRVDFFDVDDRPAGRIQPVEGSPWQPTTRYQVLAGEQADDMQAAVRQRRRLVDILLLRPPHYEIELGAHHFVAWGSRYGEDLYTIFDSSADVDVERGIELSDDGLADQGSRFPAVGWIRHPVTGPNYTVQAEDPALRQALLTLLALVILIDMERSA
jgi:hypothetical protein